MNWLIVEDALRDHWGHWVEYLRTFQRGLKSCGDDLIILCDRGANPELVAELGAKPVLPHSIWHRMSDGAGALRRYARVPGHAFATFFALRRVFSFQSSVGREQKAEGRRQIADSKWLDAEGGSNEWAPDVIFVPTVLVHHLLGWWALLKTGVVPKSSRVLLFFPNAPVRLADDARAHMAPDATGRLFRWCIRQLADEVGSGKVILGAETHAMQRALTQATGVEFTYLPHPVDVPKLVTRLPVGHLPKRRFSPPVTSSLPIVFGCYGGARWEKGADILQAAIRRVLEEKPEIPAKFVFQWMEDFDDERGRRVKLDPWLKNHPKVEVIDRYFADGEYAERLAATDVMLLPYRSPYRLRVSRVVIEAMMYGMPVIATDGTTLAEQAAAHGCVAVCQEGSAEGLAKTIAEVAAGFGSMREAAAESAAQVERQFSVACFRQLLEQEIRGKSRS